MALLVQLTTAMTTSSDASSDLAPGVEGLSPSDETRARALGRAIAEILWRAATEPGIRLQAEPGSGNRYYGSVER